MNFLETILASKRAEVDSRRRLTPVDKLRDLPGFASEPRPFTKSILAHDFGIVAEIKKASPSKGVIRDQFDPDAIARQYQKGGASAISVLTDEMFFKGSLEYVSPVREVSNLPVLRKDFIVDPYQIYESRAAGADAILLIVAALEFEPLRDLREEADALGMDVLVEVHTETELEDALESGARLIGVNNRDLQTFHVSLGTSLRMAANIPVGIARISESGIETASDLIELQSAGYHGALVGSSLMKQSDPGAALKELLAGMHAGVA